MPSTSLLDFAVITIFARETLEGGIIIGQYRTVVLRSDWSHSNPTQKEALRSITVAAIAAAFLAVIVCSAVAIPLAMLSRDFNNNTAIIIEGISKIVAAICILQLSLKMPKFFGLYYSKSQVKMRDAGDPDWQSETDVNGLSLSSIRFNVAWNIWREVAECGVFLIPFFLTGDDIKTIPLSAVVGVITGGIVCMGIYYANQRMKSTIGLTIFTTGLLVALSTGLFAGGCHKFEMRYSSTPIVWQLQGDFWSVDRLPMTIFKPFGYSDTRTVLQMVTFWLWLAFSLLVHYAKYKKCRKVSLPQRDSISKETDETSPKVVAASKATLSSSNKNSSISDGDDVEVGVEVEAAT